MPTGLQAHILPDRSQIRSVEAHQLYILTASQWGMDGSTPLQSPGKYNPFIVHNRRHHTGRSPDWDLGGNISSSKEKRIKSWELRVGDIKLSVFSSSSHRYTLSWEMHTWVQGKRRNWKTVCPCQIHGKQVTDRRRFHNRGPSYLFAFGLVVQLLLIQVNTLLMLLIRFSCECSWPTTYSGSGRSTVYSSRNWS